MINPKGSCKAAFLVQINNIEFLTLTVNCLRKLGGHALYPHG